MYPTLKQDQQQIEQILELIKSESEVFVSTVENRSAAVSTSSLKVSETLEQQGIGTKAALKIFTQTYANYFSGSAGPNYYGFVTGGATPAAVAGDWLTTIFDQNVMGSNESIASDFEVATLHMLRSLFSLSNDFEGSFVSGATMSNFTSLAIARQWLGKLKKVNIAKQGIAALGPIKLFSGTPHSSIYKSLSMLGIGREALELIPTMENREAVDVDALELALNKNPDGCIVIANAGTVNTVDFDDLVALNQLKKKFNFWLHVDAAFGGFAACSNRFKHLLEGLNFADSVTVDAHKWLNVPYDSAMQFSRHLDLQCEVFQNTAAYLRQDVATNNFINITPENSRRFRALPAWFTLQAYGADGYAEMVERASDIAAWLSVQMELHSNFELLAKQQLNGVCFTLLINGTRANQDSIEQAVELLQQSGEIYLSPTVYKEVPALRISVTNWSTELCHAKKAWKALESMVECLQRN